MSWQAFESVQDNSTITDHTALNILYVIARHADADGVVGANGRLTSPSIALIAQLARCHKNTVLNWLPKLEETGELTIDRFGKGRGQWNKYTINLPMAEDNGTSWDVPKQEINGTSNEINGTTQDVPKLELMVQELSNKVELLVQVMAHYGTTQDVPDTNNTDPEEYIYIHPDPEPIAAIKTALCQITKTTLRPETADEFDKAAYALFGWNATPETIQDFSLWWEENGYYKGLPALRSLVDEYRNFLRGVTRVDGNDNPASHQASPQVAALWESQAMPYIRGERPFQMLDPPVQAAIRQLGGSSYLSNLKAGYETNQARMKFVKILAGDGT